MQTLFTVIHIIVAVFLCLVILLQSGKGGGMGASFGGASSQIFGGRGAGNFLSKLTSGAAIVFFLTSIFLSMMSSRQHSVVHPGKRPAATDTSTPAPGTTAPAPDANAPTTPPAPAPEK